MTSPAYDRENVPGARAGASRLLGRNEVAAASVALGRAFFDDPYYRYVFPVESQRTPPLERTLRVMVGLAMPGGHVYTTPGEPVAVAAFVPPERRIGLRHVIGPALRHGPALGLSVARQLLWTLAELEAWHPKEKHWHLLVLGVDPAHQGKGIPAALMADVLARVDRERLPIYLETMRERNVGYYNKFGFRETGYFRCLGGRGPEVWAMVRPPG